MYLDLPVMIPQHQNNNSPVTHVNVNAESFATELSTAYLQSEPVGLSSKEQLHTRKMIAKTARSFPKRETRRYR